MIINTNTTYDTRVYTIQSVQVHVHVHFTVSTIVLRSHSLQMTNYYSCLDFTFTVEPLHLYNHDTLWRPKNNFSVQNYTTLK